MEHLKQTKMLQPSNRPRNNSNMISCKECAQPVPAARAFKGPAGRGTCCRECHDAFEQRWTDLEHPQVEQALNWTEDALQANILLHRNLQHLLELQEKADAEYLPKPPTKQPKQEQATSSNSSGNTPASPQQQQQQQSAPQQSQDNQEAGDQEGTQIDPPAVDEEEQKRLALELDHEENCEHYKRSQRIAEAWQEPVTPARDFSGAFTPLLHTTWGLSVLAAVGTTLMEAEYMKSEPGVAYRQMLHAPAVQTRLAELPTLAQQVASGEVRLPEPNHAASAASNAAAAAAAAGCGEEDDPALRFYHRELALQRYYTVVQAFTHDDRQRHTLECLQEVMDAERIPLPLQRGASPAESTGTGATAARRGTSAPQRGSGLPARRPSQQQQQTRWEEASPLPKQHGSCSDGPAPYRRDRTPAASPAARSPSRTPPPARSKQQAARERPASASGGGAPSAAATPSPYGTRRTSRLRHMAAGDFNEGYQDAAGVEAYAGFALQSAAAAAAAAGQQQYPVPQQEQHRVLRVRAHHSQREWQQAAQQQQMQQEQQQQQQPRAPGAQVQMSAASSGTPAASPECPTSPIASRLLPAGMALGATAVAALAPAGGNGGAADAGGMVVPQQPLGMGDAAPGVVDEEEAVAAAGAEAGAAAGALGSKRGHDDDGSQLQAPAGPACGKRPRRMPERLDM